MRQIFLDGTIARRRIGTIYRTKPPGIEECRDATFTNSPNPGRCSRHGGLMFKKAAKKLIEPDDAPPITEQQPELMTSRCQKTNKICQDLHQKYYHYLKIIEENNLLGGTYSNLNRAGCNNPVNEQHMLQCKLVDVNEGLLRIVSIKNIQTAEGKSIIVHLNRQFIQIDELISKLLKAKKTPPPPAIVPEIQPEPETPAIIPQLQPEPEPEKPDNYYSIDSNNRAVLHFDYNTYKNLPNESRTQIKRFFLWSRTQGAWISKGDYRNYRVQEIIKLLNLPLYGIEDRGTFEESLQSKIDKAENRADRNETRAQKLEAKAQQLQSEFNRLRKDWSWLTQPNINTSGGRRFTNSRNKVFERYERGSELLSAAAQAEERAATAKLTAEMREYKDYGFINRKIAETVKSIRAKYELIEDYHKTTAGVNNGTLKLKEGVTLEDLQHKEFMFLRDLNFLQTKLLFLEARKEELEETSNVYTKERLQAMNATHIKRRGDWHKIIRFNNKTVTHDWFVGHWKTPYSEIQDAKSIPKIGYLHIQNPYIQTANNLQNPALMTATSLLGNWQWSNLYKHILYKTQNHELTLYILYYLYNRKQFNQYIPITLHSEISNFIFTHNL
jgi:hypothetical protein